VAAAGAVVAVGAAELVVAAAVVAVVAAPSAEVDGPAFDSMLVGGLTVLVDASVEAVAPMGTAVVELTVAGGATVATDAPTAESGAIVSGLAVLSLLQPAINTSDAAAPRSSRTDVLRAA
jgi:hypothetical protein